MPDFHKLHHYASRLAELTAPGREEPLTTWSEAIAIEWKAITEAWHGEQAVGGGEPALEFVKQFLDHRGVTIAFGHHDISSYTCNLVVGDRALRGVGNTPAAAYRAALHDGLASLPQA